MPDGKIDRIFRDRVGDNKFFVPYYRRNSGISKTYAILMTPRSGSTWLTNEIASYDILSYPGEYFNTHSLGESIKENPCSSIVEYYDVVRSRMKTDSGIFGFEISYFDLQELEQEISLLALMEGEKYFIYLNRLNFVASGISLYQATETGIYHSTEDTSSQSVEPSYDFDKIKYWICHILQQEFGIQSWLLQRKLHYLSINYENLVGNIADSVRAINLHIGQSPVLPEKRSNAIIPQPLRRTYSAAFEQRFRAEAADWIAYWELNRGMQSCLF